MLRVSETNDTSSRKEILMRDRWGYYCGGEEYIIAPASWPDDISGNSSDRSSFARVAGVGNPERLEDCLPALRFTAGYASFSSRLASPPFGEESGGGGVI